MHVLDASEVGQDVIVSVYGGAENACGTVQFTFPDAEERRQVLGALLGWAASNEPVVLADRDDLVSLRRAAADLV